MVRLKWEGLSGATSDSNSVEAAIELLGKISWALDRVSRRRLSDVQAKAPLRHLGWNRYWICCLYNNNRVIHYWLQSHYVRNCTPTLLFSVKAVDVVSRPTKNNQLVNHFGRASTLTTKVINSVSLNELHSIQLSFKDMKIKALCGARWPISRFDAFRKVVGSNLTLADS